MVKKGPKRPDFSTRHTDPDFWEKYMNGGTTMTEISSVRVAREIQMLGENMKYFKAGNKTIVLTAENCPSNCSAWTGNPSHLGPHYRGSDNVMGRKP